MEDPKAALAKTLNQTALTQDGALAAIEGMSPALTQGVGPGPRYTCHCPMCDVLCLQPTVSRLCMLLTPPSRCCAPHCAQCLWRRATSGPGSDVRPWGGEGCLKLSTVSRQNCGQVGPTNSRVDCLSPSLCAEPPLACAAGPQWLLRVCRQCSPGEWSGLQQCTGQRSALHPTGCPPAIWPRYSFFPSCCMRQATGPVLPWCHLQGSQATAAANELIPAALCVPATRLTFLSGLGYKVLCS